MTTTTPTKINEKEFERAFSVADHALLLALLRHVGGNNAEIYQKIITEAITIATASKDEKTGEVYPEAKLARVLLDQLLENFISQIREAD
ncbi:hypothetical protein [Burkholderia gladioli]|uniref:hypothetical protein n=1 Tax=Burkholderia gladioli TaxID=28095 RepID=UPI001641EA96|nr:hypothetical protein [Burkholderia gladioli]